MTFLGDPVGEFFSTAVRDSSRLFVCGVLPGPGDGDPLLPTDVLVGPGEGDAPLPQVLFPVLEVLLLMRLLEDLPWFVLTGENSSFPPRRPSPASCSVVCSLDFMLSDWLDHHMRPAQTRLSPSSRFYRAIKLAWLASALSTYDCFDRS